MGLNDHPVDATGLGQIRWPPGDIGAPGVTMCLPNGCDVCRQRDLGDKRFVSVCPRPPSGSPSSSTESRSFVKSHELTHIAPH